MAGKFSGFAKAAPARKRPIWGAFLIDACRVCYLQAVTVFFLSDLHLENGTSAAAKRFISFLASEPKPGDLLLLGGDIFDLLVGHKAVFRARHKAVLDAILAAAARGARIHYLEGNHDFHFAALFRGQANILVHTDDFEVSTPAGRNIWVSHGDLIDEEDAGYRFLRGVTKSAPFKAFVWSMPGAVVDFIGFHSSGASRKYTSGRVENEGTERLRRLYVNFARGKVRGGYQHVLVGHSHLRDQVSLDEGGRRGEYINLGFNAERLNVAVLEPGAERFALQELPKDSTTGIIFVNPNEYFQGAVSGAVASLRLQISEHAQHYIVQLLGHYISTENLVPTDADGKPADTLTQQLAIALEQVRAEQRVQRLRQLGDYSLYIAGFFSDSLSRKLVDVDYYIGMGCAAYENVAALEEKKNRAELFLELSQKFPKFVEILSQISEETGFNPESHRDLLRVYDLWLKTGAKKFANQLVKAGINPALTPSKKTGSEDS